MTPLRTQLKTASSTKRMITDTEKGTHRVSTPGHQQEVAEEVWVA